MGKTVNRAWTVVVLSGLIASAATALGADRSAEVILKALDGVKMPTFDASKRSDQAYSDQTEFRQAMAKRMRSSSARLASMTACRR